MAPQDLWKCAVVSGTGTLVYGGMGDAGWTLIVLITLSLPALTFISNWCYTRFFFCDRTYRLASVPPGIDKPWAPIFLSPVNWSIIDNQYYLIGLVGGIVADRFKPL